MYHFATQARLIAIISNNVAVVACGNAIEFFWVSDHKLGLLMKRLDLPCTVLTKAWVWDETHSCAVALTEKACFIVDSTSVHRFVITEDGCTGRRVALCASRERDVMVLNKSAHKLEIIDAVTSTVTPCDIWPKKARKEDGYIIVGAVCRPQGIWVAWESHISHKTILECYDSSDLFTCKRMIARPEAYAHKELPLKTYLVTHMTGDGTTLDGCLLRCGLEDTFVCKATLFAGNQIAVGQSVPTSAKYASTPLEVQLYAPASIEACEAVVSTEWDKHVAWWIDKDDVLNYAFF